MSRLRVNAFGISIDGFGAGPDQSLENPMGVGGMALHEWALGTRTFQRIHADFAGALVGEQPGREDVDDAFAALRRAMEAAQGKDVRLGGGAATIRQYLREGLIDELHLAIAPTLLGRGEHLLAGIDLVRLGYRCTEHVATERATHVVLAR